MKFVNNLAARVPPADIIEADFEEIGEITTEEPVQATLQEIVAKALNKEGDKLSAEARARKIFDESGGSVADIVKEYVDTMRNANDARLRFNALQDIAKIQRVLVPPDKNPGNTVQINVISDSIDVKSVLNPSR